MTNPAPKDVRVGVEEWIFHGRGTFRRHHSETPSAACEPASFPGTTRTDFNANLPVWETFQTSNEVSGVSHVKWYIVTVVEGRLELGKTHKTIKRVREKEESDRVKVTNHTYVHSIYTAELKLTVVLAQGCTVAKYTLGIQVIASLTARFILCTQQSSAPLTNPQSLDVQISNIC